jgi:hypothetical protein
MSFPSCVLLTSLGWLYPLAFCWSWVFSASLKWPSWWTFLSWLTSTSGLFSLVKLVSHIWWVRPYMKPQTFLGFFLLRVSFSVSSAFPGAFLSWASYRTRSLNPILPFRVSIILSLLLLSRATFPFRGLLPFWPSYLFTLTLFLGFPLDFLLHY